MFVKPDKWYTSVDLAKMLGVSKGTVYNWRKKGKGPAYTILGESIRYKMEDIESWVAKNTINPSDSLDVPIFADESELVA